MTIQILRPQWRAPANVQSLSTTREGGVSVDAYRSLNLGDHVGDAIEAVRENRRRLQSHGGLPAEPVWLRQVHGVAVANLDAVPDGVVPTADAAITRRTGIVCAILTADCLPVLLTDESGEVVAAAHAGWRGLAAGVLESTVSAMQCAPARIMAWFGPRIGPQRFEVGSEVRDAFLTADPDAAVAFVRSGASRYLADLGALARLRLARLGIRRIDDAAECTHSAASRFFSHRRDGQTGRHATLIWKR